MTYPSDIRWILHVTLLADEVVGMDSEILRELENH